MIEFSYTELFLLLWCVTATGFACYYFSEFRGAKMFANMLLHDKNAREQILSKIDEMERAKP